MHNFNITKLHMIIWQLVEPEPAQVKVQLQFHKPVQNVQI